MYGVEAGIFEADVDDSMVEKPAHYQGSVECIDAIEAATSELYGIRAVCTANIIKYVWRWHRKNGAQDLRKARWYLDRLLSVIDGD